MIEVRWRDPLGFAVFAFAGGRAAELDEGVVGSAGEGEFVDIGNHVEDWATTYCCGSDAGLNLAVRLRFKRGPVLHQKTHVHGPRRCLAVAGK
jgi:hypothetical protein